MAAFVAMPMVKNIVGQGETKSSVGYPRFFAAVSPGRGTGRRDFGLGFQFSGNQFRCRLFGQAGNLVPTLLAGDRGLPQPGFESVGQLYCPAAFEAVYDVIDFALGGRVVDRRFQDDEVRGDLRDCQDVAVDP